MFHRCLPPHGQPLYLHRIRNNNGAFGCRDIYHTSKKNGEEISEQPLKIEYIAISPAKAKERIDSGDEVIILDVRTKAEYDAGHIPGAILIPNETIGSARPDLLPDLDAEILIYCRSGNRSRQAALKLIDLGYTKVYDFGGIIDWQYEITDPVPSPSAFAYPRYPVAVVNI